MLSDVSVCISCCVLLPLLVCVCVRACLFSNNNHDAAAAANADAVAGRKTCLDFHAFLYRNEFLWVAFQTRRILLINIGLPCLFTAEFACCLLTHSLTHSTSVYAHTEWSLTRNCKWPAGIGNVCCCCCCCSCLFYF